MKLVFVYNANSGFVNQSLNWMHKVLSPNTYACSLCHLTHTAFGEKEQWTNFSSQQPIAMDFLHKDAFHEKHPSLKLNFPWIGLIEEDNIIKTILDNKKLNQLKDLNELLAVLNVELKMFETK